MKEYSHKIFKGDVIMSTQLLFMENVEWLEQKVKVVSIEEEYNKLRKLQGTPKWNIKLSQKLVRLRLELTEAYDELYRIEEYILNEYNVKALAYTSTYPMSDNYYENKLKRDGYLVCIKF